MIRPLTCICMLMAAGSGLYLYQTKHRAQLLDREIAHTYDQIEQTKKRIGVLKGEWAVMNEPDRLADLARQHLTLRTLAPTQFVSLTEIGRRLPAPLPPGTLILPPPDEAPAPVTAQNPPANLPPATVPLAAAKPAPAIATPKPAPPPVQVASLPQPPNPARPAPRPAATLVAAPAGTLVPAGAATPVAATLPPPAPRLTAPIVNVSAPPLQAARAAPPLPAIVQSTLAASPIAPTPAASRYAASAPMPPPFASPQASALGGASHLALPAPVPYGASAR